MTLERLGEVLSNLGFGKDAKLDYHVYEALFAPRKRGEKTRDLAEQFAADRGCIIDVRSSEKGIWFRKDANLVAKY